MFFYAPYTCIMLNGMQFYAKNYGKANEFTLFSK